MKNIKKHTKGTKPKGKLRIHAELASLGHDARQYTFIRSSLAAIKSFFVMVKTDLVETVQGTGRKIRQHVVSDLGFGAAMSMSLALTVRNLFAGLLSGMLFGALWWRYSRRQA